MEMTDEIRKRKIKTVKTIIEDNHLSYVWLIARLRDEGLTTCRQTMSGIMAMTVRGPKMDEILAKSEEICKRYQEKMGV